MPIFVDNAYSGIRNCDYLFIIGTSLSIGYTIPLLNSLKPDTKVFYIDPEPITEGLRIDNITLVKEVATVGVPQAIAKIKELENDNI